MTATLDRLRRLPGFRPAGKDQYEARCPGHEDRKASLSIGISDGKILLHCHAGCDTDSLLHVLGLTAQDLFPGNGHHEDRRISASYDYRTLDGQLSYQVVRFEPKDFRQRKPDGNGGWTWSIKGLKRLPYCLPDLAGAEYVFVVEGEKDVESLRKIGLVGTCNSGGAGKWTAELTQYFRSDQHVTIVPDHDAPGRMHAQQVAASLSGKVASIKILELPGLPEHGDVSDWLLGRDPEMAAEELSRLSDAAPGWKPKAETEVGSAGVYRNIAAEVKEYVELIDEGSFSIQQLYSDLEIRNHRDKTTARVALHRLKGIAIETDGDRAGWYRPIKNALAEMDLTGDDPEELDLWLPLDLANYVRIMAGNIIVVTGDADSGKTAFLLNIILNNLRTWDCFYFNSEMGREELKLRLKLFGDFPLKHPHFHPFERSSDFADVIRSGRQCLNVIDYLEISENFFLVSKYLNDIHRKLGQGVAVVAIQKRDRTSNLPVGKDRALEKPRLAIALSHGSKGSPNIAEILKAKNRKVEHSLIGKTRTYKLVQGSKFISDSPGWY